jgi:microcystin-dependent protein
LTTSASLIGVPVGSLQLFAMTSVPTGWLRADGAAISRILYPDLFASIGTTYGSGDGSTTFNVPNISSSGAGSPLYYIKSILSGDVQPSTIAHAASHAAGGTDVVSITTSQITNLPPAGQVLIYANTWSGNPFDITNVFTASYRNYYIEISNIGCASGATDLIIQMIDSGGGVAGSGYAGSIHYVLFASGTAGTAVRTNGFWGCTIAASNAAGMIRGWFSGPQTATHTGYAATANSYDSTLRSGGVIQNGTSYTGFRLATVSSASSSGIIRVYGMRDAI